MLTTLQKQTELLKMRIISLGWALPPPTCLHTHRLKQIRHEYVEMAEKMGLEAPDNLFQCAQYIYCKLMGTHLVIRNLCDLFKASTYVETYMNHYFENSPKLF